MRYGPIVAKRWKKQYYIRGKWTEIPGPDPSPKQIYLILKELTSHKAIEALVGNDSWTKDLLEVKRKAK